MTEKAGNGGLNWLSIVRYSVENVNDTLDNCICGMQSVICFVIYIFLNMMYYLSIPSYGSVINIQFLIQIGVVLSFLSLGSMIPTSLVMVVL